MNQRITIVETEDLDKFYNTFRDLDYSFDIETIGLDTHDPVYCAALYHPDVGSYWIKLFGGKSVVRFNVLGKLLRSKNKKIIHRAEFEMRMLNKYGLRIKPTVYDTKVMAHLLHEHRSGLNDLAKDYFDIIIPNDNDICPTEKVLEPYRDIKYQWDAVPDKVVAEQNCLHTCVTYHLVDKLMPQLKEQGLWNLAVLEFQLTPSVVAMACRGIPVDVTWMQQESKRLSEKILEQKNKLYELMGHEINLNSSQQVAHVLYEEHGYSVPHMTDGGESKVKKPSTDASALKQLSFKQNCAIAKELLLHRELVTRHDNYLVAGLMQHTWCGRIYATFNQIGTETGRFSSARPNMQNPPRQLRRAICTSPKHYLLSADYSQIELRILAHETQDKYLKDVYINGVGDLHLARSNELGISRRDAKTVNFGVVYGISAKSIEEEYGLSREEAQGMINQFFASFPRVLPWQYEQRNLAETQGYVETFAGRRRHFPDGLTNWHERRECTNMPIQGGAAEVIKQAMINLPKSYPAILQNHDELLWEFSNDVDPMEVAPKIKRIMEGQYKNILSVPIVVDFKKGQNWAEMEKLKVG